MSKWWDIVIFFRKCLDCVLSAGKTVLKSIFNKELSWLVNSCLKWWQFCSKFLHGSNSEFWTLANISKVLNEYLGHLLPHHLVLIKLRQNCQSSPSTYSGPNTTKNNIHTNNNRLSSEMLQTKHLQRLCISIGPHSAIQMLYYYYYLDTLKANDK